MTISGLSLNDVESDENLRNLVLAAIQQITCGTLVLDTSVVAPVPCVTAVSSVDVAFSATMPLSREEEIRSAATVLHYLVHTLQGSGRTVEAVCNVVADPTSSTSNAGETLGLAFGVIGAAGMLVICCRRKRGSRVRLGMLVGEKATMTGGALAIGGRAANEATTDVPANQLFDWLDEDGDGIVTVAELAEMLDITPTAAKSLIVEAHMTLYGKEPKGNRGPTRPGEITRDDFLKLMDPTKSPNPAEISLSKEQLDRYQQMFDSIDLDGRGTITFDDLAEVVGDDSSTFEGAFTDKNEMNFEDFVDLLQRSQMGNAARAFLDLLEATPQNVALVESIREQHRDRVASGKRDRESTSSKPWTNSSPADESLYINDTPRSPYVPSPGKLSRDALEDLWLDVRDEDGAADVNEVRAAIMDAHASGSLNLNDEDFVKIACGLAESCPDGIVTSDSFWEAMAPYIDDESALVAAAVVNDEDRPRGIAIPRLGSMRIRVHLESNTMKPPTKLEGAFTIDPSRARMGVMKRQGSASRRSSVSRMDSFASIEDEDEKNNAVSTSVNPYPAAGSQAAMAIVTEYHGSLSDLLGDSDDDGDSKMRVNSLSTERAASMRQSAALDRGDSSKSGEAFDIEAMFAAKRQSRRIPQSESQLNMARSAGQAQPPPAVDDDDDDDDEEEEKQTTPPVVEPKLTKRTGNVALAPATKKDKKDDKLAGELYDATEAAGAQMNVAGKARRSSLADELFDATVVSEKMVVKPNPAGARRRSLADELYDASLVEEAMRTMQASTNANANAGGSGRKVNARRASNVAALSDELYDASLLDSAMQQFASTSRPKPVKLAEPIVPPPVTFMDAIAALEDKFNGITAAIHPHQSERDVYVLGPLQIRVQTIEGKPMVAVGDGFSTVDAFVNRRAGRIQQILEVKPGGGRRGSSSSSSSPEAQMALVKAVAESAKLVDAEIPGVFGALQSNSTKPGEFRIGTLEFSVKMEDGRAVEATSGVEVDQWLLTKKMRVRRAIFSHEKTPRAQSVWSDVHTPR